MFLYINKLITELIHVSFPEVSYSEISGTGKKSGVSR